MKCSFEIFKKIYKRIKFGPLLSMVIPVYNSENYLPQCLKSVKKASYKNLQVILINDGSTDKSLEICKSFAKNDYRFLIINQKNHGPGIARNNGIKNAKGKFITFLDNDDTVFKNHYKYSIEKLKKTHSDFTISPYQIVDNDSNIIIPKHLKFANQNEKLKTSLKQFPIIVSNNVAWSKVFNRKFYNKYIKTFELNTKFDDLVPGIKQYVFSKKFDILTNMSVSWRRRKKDISISQSMISNLDTLKDALDQYFLALNVYNTIHERKIRLTQYFFTGIFKLNYLKKNQNFKHFSLIRKYFIKYFDQIDDNFYNDYASLNYKIANYLIYKNDFKTLMEFYNNDFSKPSNQKINNNFIASIPNWNSSIKIPAELFIMGKNSLKIHARIIKVTQTNKKILITGKAFIHSMNKLKLNILLNKMIIKNIKFFEKRNIKNPHTYFEFEINSNMLNKKSNNKLEVEFISNSKKTPNIIANFTVKHRENYPSKKYNIGNNKYELMANPIIFSFKKI